MIDDHWKWWQRNSHLHDNFEIADLPPEYNAPIPGAKFRVTHKMRNGCLVYTYHKTAYEAVMFVWNHGCDWWGWKDKMKAEEKTE